ncbi:Sec-independent protein translocase protein TatB [Paracoccus sphaerophysae]|uniref:Sec-independent protein translocase protein TatB n=1 Tax=Paracoccus sphaerophysae TaxID=690417 RepID=UPI0009FC9A3B|nr:Sec-independent protein translocase protein TatB [Paracoccus sphaerophysae]
MFDVGWTELLLIGVVALIVIGPRDLPVMFHTLGRITARARGMAREFSSAMEDAAKASGVHEATKELADLKKMTSARSLGLDALSRAADKFEKWDPLEPVRDATGPVPDPAAPTPVVSSGDPAMRSSGTAAATQAAATVPDAVTPPTPGAAPAPAAAPVREPGAVATGLGLGLGTPVAEPEPPVHQPGARRLHAVRRSDRS